MYILIILAFIWLMYETKFLTIRLLVGREVHPIALEIERVNSTLSITSNKIHRAKLEAYLDILNTLQFAEYDSTLVKDILTDNVYNINTEINNRRLPFHAGARNPYPEYHYTQLEAQLSVYSEYLEMI